MSLHLDFREGIYSNWRVLLLCNMAFRSHWSDETPRGLNLA